MYFIIQAFLLHCYYAGLIPCFSFFVGSCHYLEACCLDIAERFAEIDKQIKNNSYSDSGIQIELKNIVVLHVKTVE